MSKPTIALAAIFLFFFVSPVVVAIGGAVVAVSYLRSQAAKRSAIRASAAYEMPVIVDAAWNVLFDLNPTTGERFTQSSAEEFLSVYAPSGVSWYITSREAMARQTAAAESASAAPADTQQMPAVAA